MIFINFACSNLAVILFLTITYSTNGQGVASSANSKRKDVAALSDKVSQLFELSSKKPVIRFSGNKFRELARSSPRNYSLVVMFTALSGQRQCTICKQALEEYTLVANSYRYSSSYMGSNSRLFFTMCDFDEAPDAFQLMKLNSAPVFMHLPDKGKPKKADTMDLQRVGFGAEAIAKFVQERTDVQIRIFRPPNYTGTAAMFMIFVLMASLLYLRRNNLEFLYNKNAWATLALFFVFTMISGQMWNHIRGPPLVHKTQQGVAYIHGSSQGQFVLETYFVMILYGMITFGMILLTEAAEVTSETNNGGNNDVGKRKWLAIAGLAMVAFFFSLLLSVFRSKAGGYPYSFLIK